MKTTEKPQGFFRHECRLQEFSKDDLTSPDVQERIIAVVLHAAGLDYTTESGVNIGGGEHDTKFQIE